MTGKWIKFAALAAIVAGATGCANNEELRAQIDEAMSKAESAQQTAQSAEQSAQSAQQTADRAMSAAQEAKSCCQANSKRIERSFEASQRK